MNDIQILLGDCIERMKEIPSNSIHSVVTDPPYNVSLDKQKWDNFGDNTSLLLTLDGSVSHKFAEGDIFEITFCALDEDGGETCRTELLPVSLLEQLEDSGLPGFNLLAVISALGVISILRRRTH